MCYLNDLPNQYLQKCNLQFQEKMQIEPLLLSPNISPFNTHKAPPTITVKLDEFEIYVSHQSAAAEIVRRAVESNKEATERIQILEEELGVWKHGLREALRAKEMALKSLRELTVRLPLLQEGCWTMKME